MYLINDACPNQASPHFKEESMKGKDIRTKQKKAPKDRRTGKALNGKSLGNATSNTSPNSGQQTRFDNAKYRIKHERGIATVTILDGNNAIATYNASTHEWHGADIPEEQKHAVENFYDTY